MVSSCLLLTGSCSRSFAGRVLVHRSTYLLPHQLHHHTSNRAMAVPTAQELRGQSCSLLGGCSSDTPLLPAEQLPQMLRELPAWQLSDDQASISRRFVAKNFVAAVDFFNAVRDVAEAEGHHPDLHLTNYREVEVVLSTHAIKGLSMFDLVMAAKIDQLPVTYSPKWERENAAKLGQQQQQQQQPAGE